MSENLLNIKIVYYEISSWKTVGKVLRYRAQNFSFLFTAENKSDLLLTELYRPQIKKQKC